jgi:hypothetical protein
MNTHIYGKGIYGHGGKIIFVSAIGYFLQSRICNKEQNNI